MEEKVIIYQTEDRSIEILTHLEYETVWLSQKHMAELFDKDSDTIGLHLKNIYLTGELQEKATTEKYSVVQKEGKREVKRKIQFYNLDAIISVGYRVNSKKGTQFRIWATKVLKEYTLRGFTVNKHRLEQKEQKVQILKDGIQILSRAIEEKAENNQVRFDFQRNRAVVLL